MSDLSTDNAEKSYQNYFLVGIVLFLVALSVTITQYKIPTIMVPIMEKFSIDSYAASWLMSIFTFVGIFFALPVGIIQRKIGPKKLVLFAIVLNVVAATIGAFTNDVAALLVTRAFEGASFVCVIACGPVIIQSCVDPRRVGTVSGIWMLAGMLGATLASVSTPFVFTNFGFQGLWLGYALITAISGLIFAYVIKMPKQVAPMQAQESKKIDYRIFFRKNTLLFFAPHAIFQILLLAVLTFAPTYLQQQGVDASLSGLISTVPMLLAIISSIAFGAISDATHRCKPLCVIGILSMAICTPIMLTCSGAPMWICLVAMGLLAMGMPTVIIAAYPKILGDPTLLTVGMGVLMLVQSIGQFLGSFVPAMLLGPNISNWTFCAVVLCVIGLVGTASMLACKFK